MKQPLDLVESPAVEFDFMKIINSLGEKVLFRLSIVSQILFSLDSMIFSNLVGRQKSKFALSILRHEIPDKFQLDPNASDAKHKRSIEFPDGSTQI